MHYKLDTDSHVFFYEQDYYVLSNFSAFQIEWCGFTFPTSEHVYHWEKFRDSEHNGFETHIQKQIRTAPSAHEAFKLAERLKVYRRDFWDTDKPEVMLEILRAKLKQHEYVHRKLLATGDRVLIEDSWRDDYWGWGPNKTGQNMLGQLWMQIRKELLPSTDDSEAP